MRRYFIFLLAVVIMAALYAGCSPTGRDASGIKNNKLINIKGSDTVVYLSQTLAERYMGKKPDIRITVVGGGSSTGIRALIDGTADMANASRQIKPEEREEAISKGIEPKEYIIALDGIAVVVNGDVQITSLNLKQLKDIFTGQVTNWSRVGGNDLPVTIVSRESNSGTYLYFKEHVLEDEAYSTNAIMAQSSPGVAEAVAQKSGAIGYLGIADAHRIPGVKIIPVANDSLSTPVDPSIDTIKQGSYPVSRTLQVYTAGVPGGELKKFIDFMLSPEGQAIVAELGYIPL